MLCDVAAYLILYCDFIVAVTPQVGYGKTAITLGLIAAATCPPCPSQTAATPQGLFQTNATLVIVPGHLMGQWPNEIKKFLGSKKSLIVIRNMQDFNKVTLEDLLKCDIVIAHFTVLSNDTYFTRLARLSGLDPSTVPKKKGGRHFDAIYTRCLTRLAARAREIRKSRSDAFDAICRAAKDYKEAEEVVRVDSKKSAYKMGSPKKTVAKAKGKIDAAEFDPWNLNSKKVQADYKRMACPPLELMHWNRLVVDEYVRKLFVLSHQFLMPLTCFDCSLGLLT